MTSPLITTSRWNIEDGHTLDGYLKSGGYQAIQKALEITPQEVHEEVKKLHFSEEVELAFPAGVKWGFLPENVWPRYLVVNGDESEPGTYKDRIL